MLYNFSQPEKERTPSPDGHFNVSLENRKKNLSLALDAMHKMKFLQNIYRPYFDTDIILHTSRLSYVDP